MCITEIFPFNNIEEEVDFLANIDASTLPRNSMCYLSDEVFIPFELNDKDHSSLLCDPDPDLHYFNSFNQVKANSNYYTETSFKEHVTKCTNAKDMFSMCHLNIRSISKNLSSFENYLETIQYNFTMIGLTETWLNDTNYDLYGLQGYNFVEQHRSSLGGGVALCVMKHLNYIERPDLALYDNRKWQDYDNDIESVFIEINKDKLHLEKNIIIGVLYRPPGNDIRTFNEKLESILHKIRRENKVSYILGDFNINLLNNDYHQPTGEFFNLMSSNSFLPLITRPTRVTANSATLIDNIFTNHFDCSLQSSEGIFVTDITDHYPVFHINHQIFASETEIYMERRLYNQRNKQAFLQVLQETDWSDIFNIHGTQSCFNTFHDKLVSLLNKSFPKVRIKKKYNNRKPWLSDALRNSIKLKNKLYYKYRKISSVYNETCYKSYKQILQKTLIAAEKQYYHELVTRNKDNMKKSWGIIKDIINKNKNPVHRTKFNWVMDQLPLKMSVSEHFNDFFINIGPNLAKSIPHVKRMPMSYLGDALQETIFLEPVTCEEINSIVSNLKNNATGSDDISAVYLKMSLPSIANPLVYICNMSLSEGVFPTQLKMANVVPLYKCDDPMMFNHYRPVSLLCTLSKVFEKIMYNRLIKFLDKFSILYEYQFGLRRKRSTHMALISLIDKLTQAIENGEYVIGVFLDFSKAFDTVDHKILLDKLYHYGVRGCAHKWFISYLTDRQQFVTYNGVKSRNQLIKCGVPQGSILGPLLFLIYINDLASVCECTFPILFADDSNLFIRGRDPDLIMRTMNNELKEISLWLKANKLSLNIKKTHFMIFSSKNKPHPNICINIDGETINETAKTKFLGVIIDNKLSWKDHILYISGKLARGTGVLLKVRRYLMKETLISLYYSFVYPYLIYCNHVWGLACKTHMNTLFLLQKRIIRIITGVNRRSHTDPIFKELKLLKCNDINTYLIGRLMHRIYNGDITLLRSYFKKNKEVHQYGTRQINHYHVPPVKTELGKSALRFHGVVIWNKILNLGMDPVMTEYEFSKSLKNYLLQDML